MVKIRNSHRSPVTISDTRDMSCVDPFEYFREVGRLSPVPWSVEPSHRREFAARVEHILFDSGCFAKVNALPHTAYRTARHAASSLDEGYFIIFMLSGELVVEQRNAVEVARQGDLVILDSRRPSKMSYSTPTSAQHSLAIFAPMRDFAAFPAAQNGFDAIIQRNGRILKPLSSCLSFISDKLLTSSKDELAALYNACLPLVTLAGSGLDQSNRDQPALLRSQHLFEAVLDYIDRHIANSQLCPGEVAKKFGISDRYLHKLFAKTGTSFTSYVASRRLDEVAAELASPNGRFEPIALLAYRWGFADISTFNRSFKRKFGCSPSVFRARSS